MSALPQTKDELRSQIAELGCEQICRKYRRPPLPSRLLRDLSEENQPSDQLFIASYPLSPSDLLESLAKINPPVEVAMALASNPRTPPPVLLEFIEHSEARVREAVANNPNLTAREITRLLKDDHPEVVRSLALNPGLKSQHQAFLIRHRDPATRIQLALNNNLDGPILRALGEDDSPLVRRHTAAVGKADDNLLLLWADGDDEAQQLGLLERKRLNDPVIRSLSLSRHPEVRKLVRKRYPLQEPEMVYRVDFGTEEEQCELAADPSLPIPLQHALCEKESPEIHRALARNPNLATEVFEYLLQTGEEEDLIPLFDNPRIKDDWRLSLAQNGGKMLNAVLMQDGENVEALGSELINRHLSAEATVQLAARGQKFPGLRADLARALARHRVPGLRALAATSHHLFPATLRRLGDDPVPQVARAAEDNPRFFSPHPPEEVPTYREEGAVTSWLEQIDDYLEKGFTRS